MYRFLLLFLIPFFACKQDPPQIIDLRPQVSSFDGKYVELGGVDTIVTWMDLHHAYCSSQDNNQERVFFRLAVNENKLVDSNYESDQIWIAPYMECANGCIFFRGHFIRMIFSLENDSLFYMDKHIPKWSLSSLLTSYYLFSEINSIWGDRIPYDDHRIFVESKGRFPQEVSGTLRALKWVSEAYIEIKERDSQSIPPLSIHMVQLPPPPPPPPPPHDSLRKWDGG